MLRLKDLLFLADKILSDVAVPHAIIGAFAMSALGIQRATGDIDFLVHGEKSQEVKAAFLARGFQVFHESPEVLQLKGVGQIDLLFANRPLSQAMLIRAASTAFLGIPCLDAADIIGLKIQAYHNDPRRELRDLADIQALFAHDAEIDWARVKAYAEAFDDLKRIEALRKQV